MNKKLLSLAVAAATAAPAAVLAEATLYGKAHVSIDYFDQYTDEDIPTNHTGWSLSKGKNGKGNSRGSRIGVRGSEDFGNGLKAIYQIELGIPLANEKDYDLTNGEDTYATGAVTMRNSYVGLQGDFGTFLIGRHDTPFKISTNKLDLFDDRMADYQGTLGFNDIRADNTIAYMSPDFAGFQFAAAIIPGSVSRPNPTDIPVMIHDANGLADAYSFAAIYKNGPWYGSAAYEVHTSELSGDNTIDEDFTTLRIGTGIRDWNGIYLTGIYEKQESRDFMKDNDADLWQVQAGYKFGNTMIKGMYGQNDGDTNPDNQDLSSWAVGVDHSFTKRTTLYALYTEVDRDDDANKDRGDWTGFSLGVIHDF